MNCSMDSEKFKQSAMNAGEDKKSSNTSVILAVSLAVVTVALVVLAVLGSVYVLRLRSVEEKDEADPKYQVRHDNNDRYVLEDRKDQIELIKNKDANGHLVSMLVLDYNARMISIYVPKEEKCFLIGGIVEEIGSFEDDVPLNVATGAPLGNSTDTNGPVYLINDRNPVQKISLLAKDLKPYCTNTNTLWLDRTDAAVAKKRRQRRWSITITITIRF